jgi:two-component system, NarL family, response regulator NreC
MITVLICDDHMLVRSGLHKLLEAEPDLTVTGEAADADEAVALLAAAPADVLVLDIVLPGPSGIDVLPEIARCAPGTKVLILTMRDDSAAVRQAFAAGAAGYLLKEAAEAELVHAIHEVARGRRYVYPLLGAQVVAADAAESDRTLADPLSEREHEVLRLLALGHTNQQIASRLSISVRTAESHRARIMRKLGLHTRAEIVQYALDAGDLRTARV